MYVVDYDAVFPAAVRYRRLMASHTGRVREEAIGFVGSERHLRCLWYDPKYRPPQLETYDGQQVTVLDPGRWNLEAGPDFRDATLKADPGARYLKGDVELHVRPQDWNQHGHQGDPRYRRLVAHVSWYPGTVPASALPAGVLQVSLQPAFRASPSFSFESIDVAAYPYAALDADPPCRTLLRSALPAEQRVILEAAGEERLRGKTARMAAEIEARGADQVLYEETLAALGYKHNRQPFRDLAVRIPLAVLRDGAAGAALHAYALLSGVSGLLPDRAVPAWDVETRAFIRSLWDLWWRHAASWSGRTLKRGDWVLANGRPANHPLRRLAAAAEWFGTTPSLGERLTALMAASPPRLVPAIVDLLEQAGRDSYWAWRDGLCGRRRALALSIVGGGRAAALLTNVVLPWLAAQGYAAPVTTALATLPVEDENQRVRHTAHALFGRDHAPSLYRSGLRQQGLLQIFHDFCLNRRAGCEGCRFPDALRQWDRGHAP